MNLNKEEKQLVIHLGLLSNLLLNSEFLPKGTYKQKNAYSNLLEVLELNQSLADNYLNIFNDDNSKMLFDDFCGKFDFETPFMPQDFLNNLLYLCENSSKKMQLALNTKTIKKWLKACGAFVPMLSSEKANKVIKEFKRVNTFEYE